MTNNTFDIDQYLYDTQVSNKKIELIAYQAPCCPAGYKNYGSHNMDTGDLQMCGKFCK